MNKRRVYNDIINLLDVKKCRFLNSSPKSILFLVLWVTNRCNLRCKMCDQWKTKPEMFSRELSTEEWFSVIDSAAKMHTMVITLTGGEPFLRADTPQILKRIHENGIKSHVCTNGTLINNALIKKLMHSPPDSVSVSLDGPETEIHDKLRGKKCFSNALNGIKLLKEKLPSTKVGINFIMCKQNFYTAHKMVPIAQQLGVDRLNVLPIHTNLQHRNKHIKSFEGLLFDKEDMPHVDAEIKKFMNEISKTNIQTISGSFAKGIPLFFQSRKNTKHCYAGYISCAIDPLGYVSPCDNMDGIETVRDKKLEDIWRSYSFKQLRSKVHRCQSNCWDTTHAELNLRCSLYNSLKELDKILKDLDYYLDLK